MKLIDALAKRIEELRINEKLTVHGFSLKVGIPNSTLKDILNGRYQSIQIKHIFSICDGLNISLVDFFSSPCFDKDTLTD